VLARLGLALVGAAQAEIGVWGLVSPHGFFEDFPGFGGQHWVRTLGAYNEHLVRDYAAAELGFAVLLVWAAVSFSRPLVLAAGAARLAAPRPHVNYHLTTTDHESTFANAASLGSFAVEIAVVTAVMASCVRSHRRTP
jgi:hypothetical protein